MLGETPMMSYQVSSPLRPMRGRFLGALVSAAVWALLCSTIQRLTRGSWDLFAWAIGGFVFSVVTLFSPHNAPSYVLEVDEDEIRLVSDGRVRRTVRKNHIRYVHERGSGTRRRLVVSERTAPFTRWGWGGIAIPTNLSDYERIKTEALKLLSPPA
jgi:hypothetical protein